MAAISFKSKIVAPRPTVDELEQAAVGVAINAFMGELIPRLIEAQNRGLFKSPFSLGRVSGILSRFSELVSANDTDEFNCGTSDDCVNNRDPELDAVLGMSNAE